MERLAKWSSRNNRQLAHWQWSEHKHSSSAAHRTSMKLICHTMACVLRKSNAVRVNGIKLAISIHKNSIISVFLIFPRRILDIICIFGASTSHLQSRTLNAPFEFQKMIANARRLSANYFFFLSTIIFPDPVRLCSKCAGEATHFCT